MSSSTKTSVKKSQKSGTDLKLTMKFSDWESFFSKPDKGLTQEAVAELSGTNKSYISKLERDLKDVRFSKLERVIKEGFGGHLEISIKF